MDSTFVVSTVRRISSSVASRMLKGGPVDYRYGMDVGAVAHGYRAWCLGMLGYPEQAIEGRNLLLEVLERTNHPFSVARGLNYCSMISVVQRDWRGALQFADRAIQESRMNMICKWSPQLV